MKEVVGVVYGYITCVTDVVNCVVRKNSTCWARAADVLYYHPTNGDYYYDMLNAGCNPDTGNSFFENQL